jgi:YebC/PmpR family DNA-binding regulatory protein
MSGHSKWSTIKRKKAVIDAKRGQAFTKIIKEITVAARVGGGDPAGNPRLRLLLDKAKNLNMPADNAQRAIKKGTGELPGVSYEEFTYEGYGPYGTAVIIETLSDNKNRTIASLRHLFSSHHANIADNGAVNWMFEKLGVVRATDHSMSEDELLEKLIAFDIKDIRMDDHVFSIMCDPRQLETVRKGVEQIGLKIENAAFEWVPKTTVSLEPEQEEKALAFLSELQDDEDVQNVYTNLA